jgi:hypothetical protein
MMDMTPRPYNQQYGTAYTRQPPQHDPWNQQIPPRNPEEPQAGVALFAPESDPNWTWNMQNWTYSSTDPSILISPSDAAAPPLDNQFYFDQSMGGTNMGGTNMEMSLSNHSSFNGDFNRPSLSTNSSFAGDFNRNFSFTQTVPYIQEPIVPTLQTYPSTAVSITSTTAQAPLSPTKDPSAHCSLLPALFLKRFLRNAQIMTTMKRTLLVTKRYGRLHHKPHPNVACQ